MYHWGPRAFWNRFFPRCWWMFGGKMEASWHQDRSKIDVHFEKRCLTKIVFVLFGEKPYFWRFWRSKLGPKIDQKSIRKWVQHRKVSWHRFWRIWVDFWTQLGRQNPSKVDVKMHLKMSKIEERLENIFERSGGAISAPGGFRHHGRAHSGWRISGPPMSTKYKVTRGRESEVRSTK